MRKRFKSRKHFKFRYFFWVLWCFFVLIFFVIFRFFLSFKIIDIGVVSLLDSFNVYSGVDFEVFFMRTMSGIVGVDINKPDSILQNMMFYHSPNYDFKYDYVINDIDDSISNVDISSPLVYIYNTHDTEEYSDNYSVFDASFYLKDRLSDLGISSIVEESRTSSIRNQNGWNYSLSYKASRINLTRVKEENSSIKLFIDLHRDSVGRNYTSAVIGDKSFAKVLFVVGCDHDNYLDNLFFTQSIDDIISHNYPSLTKGILEKSGYGVNGIYNQDVDSSVILMEVGGNENTSIEVKNTLDVIATIIKEKLNE